MFRAALDVRDLDRNVRGFANRLPNAVSAALNDAAFATREEWKREAQQVFDRPTPLTVNAALVRKSTPQTLVAEVFIRDDVSSGAPPSEYLQHQVKGGTREQRRFEFSLSRSGGAQFYAPGRQAGLYLDPFGNIGPGAIRAIQSQLGAAELVSGFSANRTRTTRERQRRRIRRQGGGGGQFFMLPADRGKLKRGVVYERLVSGQGPRGGFRDNTVRAVLFAIRRPVYRRRYDVFSLAQRTFDRLFAQQLQRQLKGFR